jgi:Protein of unknown function (DUF4012)
VLVVLLAGILGTAIGGFLAYTTARTVEAQVVSEFTAGQQQLQDGKSLLQKATKDNSPSELAQARADFVSAKQHFSRAPELLSRNAFLSAATSFGIPYVAPRLRAARSLATMGTSLADAALIGADIDALLVHPGGASSGGPFAVLKAMSPRIPDIKSDLNMALTAALAVDPSLLPASQAAALHTAIGSIRNAIGSVDQLANVLPVAIEIFGGNGLRKYLVEQAANAELRAGGGFIGSASLVDADAGQMKIAMSGAIDPWIYPRPNRGQPGYIEPPGPLQMFIGNAGWDLADSNFYPDFRTSAQLAEKMGKAKLNIDLDGVISIDPEVIGALLSVTGPITVPGYGVTVGSSNFTSWLFEQQYAPQNANSPTKKIVLSSIAAQLIPMVTSLPPSRWPDLMTVLNTLATQRHLQIYFNNPQAESFIDQYGWSGTMNPRHAADYMYEVESNFGATKANHFLSRTYTVDLSVVNGKLRHAVTVQLVNSEPSRYEGGNLYDCYLRLFVPAAASAMRLDYLTPNRIADNTVPSGYKQFEGWFEIRVNPSTRYGERTIRFWWDTPWDGSAADHVIYWQKQPGTSADKITVVWHSGGSAFSATGALDADKQIELTSGGVKLTSGQAGTASVPSLSL